MEFYYNPKTGERVSATVLYQRYGYRGDAIHESDWHPLDITKQLIDDRYYTLKDNGVKEEDGVYKINWIELPMRNSIIQDRMRQVIECLFKARISSIVVFEGISIQLGTKCFQELQMLLKASEVACKDYVCFSARIKPVKLHINDFHRLYNTIALYCAECNERYYQLYEQIDAIDSDTDLESIKVLEQTFTTDWPDTMLT